MEFVQHRLVRKYMKHIFELRIKDQIEERSSQLLRNLSSCEKKAWKKFRLERDSSPWPLRCRCSALPTELSSQLGAGHITNSQYDQLPVSLIAQLVEHCTGIAEVMGSNAVQAWIFFRLSFLFATARFFLLFDLSSEVQIYVSYIYIHLFILHGYITNSLSTVKPKLKQLPLANHNRHKQHNKPFRIRSKCM